jgi:hypothetical protein
MTCELCLKELESYCEGKLPGNTRILVKIHLDGCANCADTYRMIILSNRIISEERELKTNPFLSGRIMAEIENRESALSDDTSIFSKTIRPVFITISMAAAIFAGVILGNFGHRQELVPAEFALMDDMEIESDLMLINE